MLHSLTISNYALIEELKLDPTENFNVITGETGAGKSIMLGALGLIMGNRTETKVLWDETKKCYIEAIFNLTQYDLKDFFKDNELDYDPHCIIRREIAPNGKSRAFINDSPVNLELLKQLSNFLMDIHSQYESLELGKSNYQLNILDIFSKNTHLRLDYKDTFQTFKLIKHKYESLVEKSKSDKKHEDYLRFQFQELFDAQLDNINQEELENKLKILENAEEIKKLLNESNFLLYENENSIINQLSYLKQNLKKLNALSIEFQKIYEQIESISIEMTELNSDLISKNDKIIYDPEKMMEIQSILDNLYKLQKKHQVSDVQSLKKLRDEMDTQLQQMDNFDEDITKLEKSLNECKHKLLEKGKILTENRKQNATIFAQNVEQIIHQIGIQNGRVHINIQPIEPTENGLDLIEILFSANKGIEPKEIKQVASGGEFSRLIFAIKYLIADKTALPTIIFDEIDTGVSGEIALKMAKMMRKMAKNHQIISISHLPQIAAGANTHFYVFKSHEGNKSKTCIKKLSKEERVHHIATMIGGDDPSILAFQNAMELLEKRD